MRVLNKLYSNLDNIAKGFNEYVAIKMLWLSYIDHTTSKLKFQSLNESDI